jgi:5-methylcytosine-specific restriction endonuclease McrA
MHSWIDETSLIPKRETKARFRLKIFDAFRGTCAYCGEHAQSLDHVIPKHRGGQTVIENLVPACLRCNGSKGSTEWTLWYRDQEFYAIDSEIAIWEWIYQFRDELY